MKIDGILLEVIGNTFMSIAEEMGAVLVKSAYSTNIKERKDCSCALFDAAGNTIPRRNTYRCTSVRCSALSER